MAIQGHWPTLRREQWGLEGAGLDGKDEERGAEVEAVVVLGVVVELVKPQLPQLPRLLLSLRSLLMSIRTSTFCHLSLADRQK